MTRLLRRTASTNVLLLLCAMYFITYTDRVNVSSAAESLKQGLHLTNTELGVAFSAFGYPYLLFQIVGGWFGDRFGARWTLGVSGFISAAATMLTGAVGGLGSLIAVRVLLGFGEGATFPVATRAMASWLPGGKSGWAQGVPHACARIGNASMFGPRIVRTFEAMKDAFDPAGLLNPGRVMRPPRMDDRSLFRYPPGYTPDPAFTPQLDWSEQPQAASGGARTGLLAAVEMCNNNGTCRTFNAGVMCPSYRVTRDEVHLTRGRANTLRLALTGQLGPDAMAGDDVAAAIALCVSCPALARLGERLTGLAACRPPARLAARLVPRRRGGRAGRRVAAGGHVRPLFRAGKLAFGRARAAPLASAPRWHAPAPGRCAAAAHICRRGCWPRHGPKHSGPGRRRQASGRWWGWNPHAC